MAKTDRDVVIQALRIMNVASLHDSGDEGDFAEAKRHYDWLLVALDDVHRLGLGIVSNDIPDWAFMPLARVVAGLSAPSFGLPEFVPLEARGLRELRVYAANEVNVNQTYCGSFY